MQKIKTLKNLSKSLLSVLLVMTVMLSVAVPGSLTAYAEETPTEAPAEAVNEAPAEEEEKPAEGAEIYAFLNKIDNSKSASK